MKKLLFLSLFVSFNTFPMAADQLIALATEAGKLMSKMNMPATPPPVSPAATVGFLSVLGTGIASIMGFVSTQIPESKVIKQAIKTSAAKLSQEATSDPTLVTIATAYVAAIPATMIKNSIEKKRIKEEIIKQLNNKELDKVSEQTEQMDDPYKLSPEYVELKRIAVNNNKSMYDEFKQYNARRDAYYNNLRKSLISSSLGVI